MRLIRVVAVVLVLLALGGRLGAQEPAAAEAATGATSPPKLIALGEEGLPPFQFIGEGGLPRGILIDLWHLWERRTGIRVAFRLMPWEEALDRFRAGEGDILIGIIQTPERESWLDFTEPYFVSRLEVFVPTGAEAGRELGDLTGRRIGVVRDDYAHIYLAAHLPQGAEIVPFASTAKLLAGADAGQIDAFLGYHNVIDYTLAQNSGLGRYTPLRQPCATLELRAAVRKGDAELLAQLNRGLAQISRDERDAITMQWNVAPPGQSWLILAFGLILGGLLALGGGLWLLYRRHTALRLEGLSAGLREQQRETEQAVAGMRFNEQRLRAFTETLSGILFIIDGEGRYIDIFGSEDELLAAPRERLIGNTVSESLPAEAAEPIMEALSRAIATRRLQVVEYELEVPRGRRNFEGRVSYIPESPPERPMTVFLALDVTEQKQLADQLRHAQKMEAIGRLAGGVAHDFNNILTAILGFTEMAEVDADDPRMARMHLGEIRESAERAAALTRQLLAFSRRQILEPKPLDLNEGIGRIEPMLRRLIGDHIDLRLELAPKLFAVRADPSQLDQIVMNLAVNARDAMPGGGRLVIRTEAVDCASRPAGPTANLPAGEYALLEVSDNGAGIPEEIRSRIFEPFFTTKALEQGTGLGLSTVYGIAKQSGGDIVCTSRSDRGTTFRVFLPRAREGIERPAEEGAALAVSEEAPAGAAAVLVVEDNTAVRNLIGRVLRGRGYRVREAADAGEALEIFEEDPSVFDLLITDILMPGMSGTDLARRLAGRAPRIRVLFISGYTDGHRLDLPGGTGELLRKPFSPEELLARTERSLKGTAGRGL